MAWGARQAAEYGARCRCGLHAQVRYRWEADRDARVHHEETGHIPIIWKCHGPYWQYPVVPQPRFESADGQARLKAGRQTQ